MSTILKKNKNLSIITRIPLKKGVVDGSIVDGLGQPILFPFVSDKSTAYKVFSEPETFPNKKLIISVLNTITFYFLEDDNHEEVDFNRETLTFTLQTIKIRNIN